MTEKIRGSPGINIESACSEVRKTSTYRKHETNRYKETEATYDCE